MMRQQESVFFVDALGAFFMWVLVKPWLFQQEVVWPAVSCEVFCLLATERNLKGINFLLTACPVYGLIP